LSQSVVLVQKDTFIIYSLLSSVLIHNLIVAISKVETYFKRTILFEIAKKMKW